MSEAIFMFSIIETWHDHELALCRYDPLVYVGVCRLSYANCVPFVYFRETYHSDTKKPALNKAGFYFVWLPGAGRLP